MVEFLDELMVCSVADIAPKVSHDHNGDVGAGRVLLKTKVYGLGERLRLVDAPNQIG